MPKACSKWLEMQICSKPYNPDPLKGPIPAVAVAMVLPLNLKRRNWPSKGCRIRLSMWRELELSWKLLLHSSWNLAYQKNSDIIYFLWYNSPQVNAIPQTRSSPSVHIQKLIHTRCCTGRYAASRAFIWGHSDYPILDDQFPSPSLQRSFMATYGMWLNY